LTDSDYDDMREEIGHVEFLQKKQT